MSVTTEEGTMNFLEKITLNTFYSPVAKFVNDRVFLQFRPTFCRAGNPHVGPEALHHMLTREWPGSINDRGDLTRYYFLYLQLMRIEEQKIPGDIAELGVYKGNTALFISRVAPQRVLHLFDTFEGFHSKDSDHFAKTSAFKDVSLDEVRRLLPPNAKLYPGYFPETAAKIEPGTKFSMLHVDMDLETPISAALDYFYPLVSPGGAIIVHDYNNTGSWDRGAKKAVDRFLDGKPETAVEMPDRLGSVVIAKNK
jgi:O-methyltransferase